MVHFIPLAQLPSATETTQVLVDRVFRHHGIPLDIVSDRGPQFVSQVWKTFCSALGTTVSLTSGYHPQSNGQAERANQELEAALRCLAAQNNEDWSQYLVWIEYAHNTHASSATGVSPFEAALGYSPPLFPLVPSVQQHLQRCQQVWRQTTEALLRTKESNCRIANRHRVVGPVYQPGQQVWLSARNIPIQASSWKLAPRFIGPYTIEKIINPTCVRLRLPRALRYTLPSTFHKSSPSRTALCARRPLPRRPPVSSMALLPLRSAVSWTFGVGVVGTSSWLIGRAMIRRSDPGSPALSSWTRPSSRISSGPILIAVLDRLEAVVEGGVLSWCLCQLSSPSPLCLATDSSQLRSLISSTCQTYLRSARTRIRR
uniref:Integrase catalytic domain-containing protein n=1 Tax=Oryzias sinensis TaxID=183150 RepID=A0A8C7WT17_9TELE